MQKKQKLTYRESELLLNAIKDGADEESVLPEDESWGYPFMLREFWKPHPILCRLEKLEPTFWAKIKLAKKGLIVPFQPLKISPKGEDIFRLPVHNSSFVIIKKIFYVSLTKRDINIIMCYNTEEDEFLAYGHRSLAGRFFLCGNTADLIDYATEDWLQRGESEHPDINISTTLEAIMAVLQREDQKTTEHPPAVDKLLADLAELGEKGVYYLKGLLPTRSLMIESWTIYHPKRPPINIAYIRGIYGWLFRYDGDRNTVGRLSIASYSQARQEILDLLNLSEKT